MFYFDSCDVYMWTLNKINTFQWEGYVIIKTCCPFHSSSPVTDPDPSSQLAQMPPSLLVYESITQCYLCIYHKPTNKLSAARTQKPLKIYHSVRLRSWMISLITVMLGVLTAFKNSLIDTFTNMLPLAQEKYTEV